MKKYKIILFSSKQFSSTSRCWNFSNSLQKTKYSITICVYMSLHKCLGVRYALELKWCTKLKYILSIPTNLCWFHALIFNVLTFHRIKRNVAERLAVCLIFTIAGYQHNSLNILKSYCRNWLGSPSAGSWWK